MPLKNQGYLTSSTQYNSSYVWRAFCKKLKFRQRLVDLFGFVISNLWNALSKKKQWSVGSFDSIFRHQKGSRFNHQPSRTTPKHVQTLPGMDCKVCWLQHMSVSTRGHWTRELPMETKWVHSLKLIIFRRKMGMVGRRGCLSCLGFSLFSRAFAVSVGEEPQP